MEKRGIDAVGVTENGGWDERTTIEKECLVRKIEGGRDESQKEKKARLTFSEKNRRKVGHVQKSAFS